MELDAQGEAVPALESMPELHADLIFYWDVFLMLSGSRPTGFGMGYVPLSEISNCLDEHRIWNWEERLEAIHWIQFIDRQYVSLNSEKKATDGRNKSNR